jgi:hypothetical protein
MSANTNTAPTMTRSVAPYEIAACNVNEKQHVDLTAVNESRPPCEWLSTTSAGTNSPRPVNLLITNNPGSSHSEIGLGNSACHQLSGLAAN